MAQDEWTCTSAQSFQPKPSTADLKKKKVGPRNKGRLNKLCPRFRIRRTEVVPMQVCQVEVGSGPVARYLPLC